MKMMGLEMPWINTYKAEKNIKNKMNFFLFSNWIPKHVKVEKKSSGRTLPINCYKL